MKVISVVGARPNFMKVAPIHRAFKKHGAGIEHKIVHTGQHYDAKMSDAFFRDLELPEPDFFLGVGSGTHAEQTAKVMIEFEKVCLKEKPNLVIVVGDVNSTVACSLTAKKLSIDVAHVEAGLRSNDRSMPEELNRIVTDSISDYAFVTEESGKENLLRENFPEKSIFFTGNTMIDSLVYAEKKADELDMVSKLGLEPQSYVLATLHRPSNVDNKAQLEMLLDMLLKVAEFKKVVFPAHPRTTKNIAKFSLQNKLQHDNIKVLEPLGYLEFLSLMKKALFVLTDSGGIQEETTYLRVPCLTLRTTTERPSTINIGSNKLVQPEKASIEKAISDMRNGEFKTSQVPELWDGNAAIRIVGVIKELIIK